MQMKTDEFISWLDLFGVGVFLLSVGFSMISYGFNFNKTWFEYLIALIPAGISFLIFFWYLLPIFKQIIKDKELRLE